MADNVPITAGSGTNIATDQLAGGEHVQVVKLADGTADSATRIPGKTVVPGESDAGLLVREVSAQPDKIASGVIDAAAETVVVTLPPGCGSVGLRVAGNLTGTLFLEATIDDTTWTGIPCFILINGAPINAGSDLSIAGDYRIAVQGLLKVRIRCNSYSTGSATITFLASRGPLVPVFDGFTILKDENNLILELYDSEPGASVVAVPVRLASPAHDAPISTTTPVTLAGVAEDPADSAPTNLVSAEGDVTRISTDRSGALFTYPHPQRIWHTAAEYTTQQTDTEIKAAPGSGLSLYIRSIYVMADTTVTVTLEQGTSTLKFRAYCGTNGGAMANFDCPIQLSANTALTVTSDGAVTFTIVVTGFTAS